MFLLNPTSIALIGASSEEKKLGNYIVKNLLEGAYKGKVYPVNPKHESLLGVPCYHTIGEIEANVDCAIIVTPAPSVSALAIECGKKKVKTLVVISAGFGEIGNDEGRTREHELVEIGRKYGMSIVGPNCLGILRPSIGLNGSFASTPSQRGSIALVSQSGAMAVALLDRAEILKLGFSSVVSIGNKADLNECDFLEILENDTETRVIGLYLESIDDGIRFVEIASRIAKKKPIVLIKSGVSARGAKAVSSHTGALAGSLAGLQAACVKAGIHLARDTEEFMGLLATLSTSPTLRSRNIGIITNAGGPGVLATDAAEREGLVLPALSEKIREPLKEALPPAASVANPIDVLGDAHEERYLSALALVTQDENIDGLVVILTPQVMTPCTEIAKAIAQTKRSDPLLPIVTAFMGGGAVSEARELLRSYGVPSFETPEEAVRMLRSLLKQDVRTEKPIDESTDDRSLGAHEILQGTRGLLSEEKTMNLLALYELPTPRESLARSAKEACDVAKRIGLPVIAKISSKDILHKTDVGGVRANLKTLDDVKKAYAEIVKNVEKKLPSAGIDGVTIQQFLPIGSEFIVGAIRDPNFGPLIMVGLGGIYTELFRDTCFRMAPVSEAESYDMLVNLKSWKLLLGMRGKSPLAIDKLANTIVKIGNLMHDCPNIAEIDVNPVLVGEKDIVIADVKIVTR